MPASTNVEFCALCRATVYYQSLHWGLACGAHEGSHGDGSWGCAPKKRQPSPLPDTDLAALCRQRILESPDFAALMAGVPVIEGKADVSSHEATPMDLLMTELADLQ